MRAIRFRCPRCGMHHTASAARAGQPFACSSCFAPMAIPESAVADLGEIPTARSIEVAPPTTDAPPPDTAIIERESSLDVASRPAPRPRRKPAATRPPIQPPAQPEPKPIEFPYVPEPEPVAAIEVRPIPSGPDEPSRVPLGRIVAALAAVFVLVAVVVVAGQILDSRKGTGPAAVAQSAPLAIVEAAPEQPATIPTPAPPAPPAVPAPPAAPAPVVASSVPSVSKSETEGSQAPRIEPPVATPQPEPVAPARPLVIRRRQTLDQEALRRQLSRLPEINLSDHTEAALLEHIGLQPIPPQARQTTRGLAGQAGFLGPVFNQPAQRIEHQGEGPGMHVAHQRDHSLATVALFKRSQPELGHLPWRMGEECHLPRESAEELEVQSRSLRNKLSEAIPVGDTRPDAEALRASLFSPAPTFPPDVARLLGVPAADLAAAVPNVRSDTPAAIPALMQLLMAERTPTRLVLVDLLARIKGLAASKALARLAIFDLAPEVRERAVIALRDRPTAESRPSLIEGLRYPWAPVADHSAEALVALEDREAIPTLVALLDEPDPEHPATEVRNGQPVTTTRTLVQVNHLRNCLLCHAPSTSPTTDLVRGRVPSEGMPLPPPQEYYASKSPGAFVRAEVTYLRQDFSVTQPVEQTGSWPAYQRYDYLVSERPISAHRHPQPKGKAREKVQEERTFPQRESALFALRELTGKDVGDDSAAWKAATRPKPPAE
jgi:hypothetical protein